MLVLLLVALSLAATIEQAIKVINMTIKKQVNFLFLICIVFHLLLRFIILKLLSYIYLSKLILDTLIYSPSNNSQMASFVFYWVNHL